MGSPSTSMPRSPVAVRSILNARALVVWIGTPAHPERKTHKLRAFWIGRLNTLNIDVDWAATTIFEGHGFFKEIDNPRRDTRKIRLAVKPPLERSHRSFFCAHKNSLLILSRPDAVLHIENPCHWGFFARAGDNEFMKLRWGDRRHVASGFLLPIDVHPHARHIRTINLDLIFPVRENAVANARHCPRRQVESEHSLKAVQKSTNFEPEVERDLAPSSLVTQFASESARLIPSSRSRKTDSRPWRHYCRDRCESRCCSQKRGDMDIPMMVERRSYPFQANCSAKLLRVDEGVEVVARTDVWWRIARCKERTCGQLQAPI